MSSDLESSHQALSIGTMPLSRQNIDSLSIDSTREKGLEKATSGAKKSLQIFGIFHQK